MVRGLPYRHGLAQAQGKFVQELETPLIIGAATILYAVLPIPIESAMCQAPTGFGVINIS